MVILQGVGFEPLVGGIIGCLCVLVPLGESLEMVTCLLVFLDGWLKKGKKARDNRIMNKFIFAHVLWCRCLSSFGENL